MHIPCETKIHLPSQSETTSVGHARVLPATLSTPFSNMRHTCLLLLFVNFAPSFCQQHYEEQTLHCAIAEESAPDTVVVRVPSPPQSFSTWHLLAAQHFQFEPSTQLLVTRNRLDREQLAVDPNNGKCMLEAVLTANGSNGSQLALLRVQVEVLDLNDNAPTFIGLEGTNLNLSVLESVPIGTRFWVGVARDVDAGDNGTVGGYSLGGEGVEQLFRAEKDDNGGLVLELLRQLDREQTPFIRAQVHVWDGGTPRRETTSPLIVRVLDANDNAPQFERKEYSVELRGEKGLVGMVRAQDADEGLNGEVHYRLVQPEGGSTPLTVDTRTGELRWDGSAPPCAAATCTLVVQASDQGTPSLSAKALLNVRMATDSTRAGDIATLQLYIRNLPSGQPFASVERDAPNGTVLAVVTVETEEKGSRGKIGLELVQQRGLFRLERVAHGTARGVMALLRLNASVQGERQSRWTLEVRAVGVAGQRISREVQVFLRLQNDSLLAPIPARQKVRIAHSAPVGALLARVSSVPGPVHFRLLSPEWAHLLQVHPTAGLVRLRGKFAPLQPEEGSRKMHFAVQLAPPPPSLATALAEVELEVFNDARHAPLLLSGCPSAPVPCIFSMHVPENHSMGVPVWRINTTNGTTERRVVYLLHSFGGNWRSASQFRVDPHSGEVFLRWPLDFEQSAEHRLWLRVEEAGRAAEALLELFVEDVNDCAPHFPSPAVHLLSLRLSHSSRSPPLLYIEAADPDMEDGHPDALSYAILSSDAPPGAFELEHRSGTLRWGRAAEGMRAGLQFTLQIGAVDSANHSSASPLTVHIRMVADSAKLPPYSPFVGDLRRILLPARQGECLDEATLLRQLDVHEGQSLSNISALFPSSAAFVWTNRSLCLARLPPTHSESVPLVVDLGPDGWMLVSCLFHFKVPPPRLSFADPAPELWIRRRTIIGSPLHRFRVAAEAMQHNDTTTPVRYSLEGAPEGMLGIHPQNGLVWLNGGFVGVEQEEAEWTVRAEAEGLGRAEQKFRSFPPSISLHLSNPKGSLRPGDLLVDLRLSAASPPSDDSLLLTFSVSSPLPTDWSTDTEGELLQLFPNGEIRLLENPPSGQFFWRRQVEVKEMDGEWGEEHFTRNHSMVVQVTIESDRPLLPLTCPDPPLRLHLARDILPGTPVGRLGVNPSEGNSGRLFRFRLQSQLEQLVADEVSGELRVHTRPRTGNARERMHYSVEEVTAGGSSGRVECSALLELDAESKEEGGEERAVVRVELSHREATRRAAAAQALTELAVQSGGTTTKVHLWDRLGSGQQFEFLPATGHLFVANSSSPVLLPLYVLESPTQQIRIRIVPPFADSVLRIELSPFHDSGALPIRLVPSFHPQLLPFLRHSPLFSLHFSLLQPSPDSLRVGPLSGQLYSVGAFCTNCSVGVRVEERWSGASGTVGLQVGGREHRKQRLFFVRENAPLGETVAAFGDDEWPAQLRLEGTPFERTNGTLVVGGHIDAEQQALYGLGAEVGVLVTDENEHPPALTPQNGLIVVPENAPIGARITRLQWTDADLTSDPRAEVDSFWTEDALFYVDAEGWLRVGGQLDRERGQQHQVHVQVWDGQPPGRNKVLSSTAVLNISVADENDCAPSFDGPLVFFVHENSPIGTVFGAISASDPDLGENGTVRYRLLAGAGVVALDPVLGYLSVNGPLDREDSAELELEVEAVDLGTPSRSSRARVRVTVVDQDDHPPMPEKPEVKAEIGANAGQGEVVATLGYRDEDENANALALFSIVGGDPNAQFRVGLTTGVLSLARPLDHAAHHDIVYRLNVSLSAFSGKWPPSFCSVAVAVLPPSRPPPPMLLRSIRVDLSANPHIPLPLSIHRIAHTQDNATFSVKSGNRSLFSVHPSSGTVHLLRRPASACSVHPVSILLSTTRPFLFLLLVHIHPADRRPPLLHPPIAFLEVTENSPSPKELLRIGTAEEGLELRALARTIRYRVEEERCEKGQSDERRHFKAHPVEGQLALVGSLDAESCSLWRVHIRATDMDEWTPVWSEAMVRIAVRDVDEHAPELKAWAGADSFISDAAKTDFSFGEIVLALDAFEADVSGGAVQVSLEGEDADAFAVDERGVLKLARDSLSDKGQFEVMAVAGNRTAAIRMYAAPAAQFPAFAIDTPRSLSLPSDPHPLHPLARFRARPPPSQDNFTSNPALWFAIASGDPRSQFRIDSRSGEMFWVHSHGKVPSRLVVAVSNPAGPYSAFLPVKLAPALHIAPFECLLSSPNATDASAAFLSVQLTENEPPSGEGVARIEVNTGEEEAIELLEQDQQTEAGLFRLQKGRVLLARALDREKDGQLRRVAIRNGNATGCVLEVHVLDTNDNAPRFTHILSTSVGEATPPGSLVFRVQSEDPDSAEHAHNWYSLESDGGQTMFSIDAQTGEVRLEGELDREQREEWQLRVAVQDEEWRVQSTLTVRVSDANNNVPRFEKAEYEMWLNGTGERVRVGEVGAADADQGRNAELHSWLGEEAPHWVWLDRAGQTTELWANARVARIAQRGGQLVQFPLFCADNGIPRSDTARTNVQLHLPPSAPIPLPSSTGPEQQEQQQLPIRFEPSPSSSLLPYFSLPPSFALNFCSLSDGQTVPIGRLVVDRQQGGNDKFRFSADMRGGEVHYGMVNVGVDEQSGVLSINGTTKGGECTCAQVEVVITVGASGEHGQGAQMELRLLPLGTPVDHSPDFVRHLWHFAVPRHSPTGTIVGRVGMSVASLSSKYALLVDSKEFQIDASGEITIAAIHDDKKGDVTRVQVVLVRTEEMATPKEWKRCFVHIHFVDQPALAVFPIRHLSLTVARNTLQQTELLRFDFLLPKEARLAVVGGEESSSFCFPSQSPNALVLCRSLLPSASDMLSFQLAISFRGRIRSRAFVSVQTVADEEMAERIPIGGIGFLRANAPKGQTVLRLFGERAPFEMVHDEMSQSFLLNSSTGTLSLLRPLPSAVAGRRILYPISARSANSLLRLFVLLDEDQQQLDHALPEKEHSWASTQSDLEYDGNLLSRLVELRVWGTQRSLAELLDAIAGAVPEQMLLTPISLFSTSSPPSLPFRLHRLLLAFRNSNGVLPPVESLLVLQHFGAKNAHQLANVWDYRVQKVHLGKCTDTMGRECAELVRKCLRGNAKAEMASGDRRGWHSPVEVEESCLFPPHLPPPQSGPACCSGEERRSSAERTLSFHHSSPASVRLSGLSHFPHTISLSFTTTQSSALLLYVPSAKNSTQFLSIDLINGKPRLNISPPLQSHVLAESANTGEWQEVTLQWEPKRAELALEMGNGKELKSVGVIHMANSGILSSFSASSSLFLGDLSVHSDLLRHPSQMASYFFSGCIRRIAVNGLDPFGEEDDELLILREQFPHFSVQTNTTFTHTSQCPVSDSRRMAVCQDKIAVRACSGGICVPENTGEGAQPRFSCVCGEEKGRFEAASCAQDFDSLDFAGSPLRLSLSPSAFRRLSFVPLAGNLVHEVLPSTDLPTEHGTQRMELDFRSRVEEGTLMCAEMADGTVAEIKLNDSSLHYLLHHKGTPTRSSALVIGSVTVPGLSADQWHRLTLEVSLDGQMLRLQADANEQRAKGGSPSFPHMLSAQLKHLWLGSCPPLAHPTHFKGCMRRFLLNGQLQQIHPEMAALAQHKKFLQLDKQQSQPWPKIGCRSDSDCSSSVLSECTSFNFGRLPLLGVLSLLPLLALLCALVSLFILFRRRRERRAFDEERNKEEEHQDMKSCSEISAANTNATLRRSPPGGYASTVGKSDKTLSGSSEISASSSTFSGGFSSYSSEQLAMDCGNPYHDVIVDEHPQGARWTKENRRDYMNLPPNYHLIVVGGTLSEKRARNK